MYVSHLLVRPQTNAQLVICVLPINVTYRVPTIYLVLLVNVAPTTSAPKYATQTITVYRVKFATTKEHANRDVHPTAIVQPHKFASMANVNVDLDLLERHSAVRILMNVRKSRAIQVHVAKIHRVRSDVLVQIKLLEIPIAILVVYNRINVVVTLIVLIIWLVCKESVPILAL